MANTAISKQSKKLSFPEIEAKWQKRWEKARVFEADVDTSKKKFFVNFPYPYINAFQHIGHLYTLMRVEALARYKRLKGFNVLFPQGWHATGSPIVLAAKRVKEKEPKQLKIMRDMGITGKELAKFENPEHWIDFFVPEFKKDYTSIGMSVDWRREFHTTSLNPHYDKFIKWQFKILKDKGYCIKGRFPVVWDPKENIAIGDHDRVEGEGEVPQEFYLFKFPLSSGKNIITATLRHDTVWGITNIYVHPDIEYIEAQVNEETWIISEKAVNKLRNQEYKVKELRKLQGRELIGEHVKSFGGKEILVLPATFINLDYGTGIVHSVPSDSADDLIALRDLQANAALLKKYNLAPAEVKAIKPIEIFHTPGIGGNPAQYFIDKYNIKNQNEREKLELVKKELYKLTFNQSKFGPLYKKGFSRSLEGLSIPEGQEIIKRELLAQNKIALFYQLTGKVVSRSLTECVVKIVDDQWFLDYANPEWKAKTKKCLDQAKLYPEKARQQFEYVIGWLHEWACTREEGLGTRLPWDNKWLIESLSDSTIYMAYYTIVHLIKKIPVEELNDEFFDYVFLGKGKGKKEWKAFHESFDYWYPVDFRNSGKDLIQNHLAFFMFNHTAIFPEKYWPKGIGVNGWVTVDGQKMSKSLGNMIPVRDMMQKFGADASRLTILNGGEGMDDPNWESAFVESLKGKFSNIYETILDSYGKGRKSINDIDRLFESRSNTLLKHINIAMEETLFRTAIQRIFFDYWKLIKDYIARTDGDIHSGTFKELSKNFVIMLSPFCPHLSEEMWIQMGGKGFVSLSEWPVANEKKINEELEKKEKAVEQLSKDLWNIINIMKDKSGVAVKKAYVYVLPMEKEIYSAEVLEKKIGVPVTIFAVNDKNKYDPQNKAAKTKPGKPGIYLE